MIRKDFVSNSSTTAFIVSAEDNKYDILLNDDYDVLTLKDYVEHYIKEDIFTWYTLKSMDNLKFVSASIYNKMFATGLENTFPENTRDMVEAYVTLSNNRPDAKWDSDEVKKWSSNLDSIMDNIKKKILETLQLKWKDVKFHYTEASDNEWLDEEKYPDVNNQEDLVESRIDYMNSIKPLKFLRKFSHH